jgi:ABC-type antimicrobial peptide transport system permease subunit
MIRLVRWFYARLLWLYPQSFRAQFVDEMQQVFAQVLADAAPRGPVALLAVCARELCGVLVGGMAARAHAIRAALWGGVLPPDTFSLEATLRRLLLVVGGLAGLGLVFTICLSVVLDVMVPQTATAPIDTKSG